MNRPDPSIWSGVLAYLRTRYPDLCRHWFEELEPIDMSSGTLVVRAASSIHRDYLNKRCRDAFVDALQTTTGRLLTLRFIAADDPLPETRGSAAAQGGDRDPSPLRPPVREPVVLGDDSLAINPDNRFDTFVEGPNNRLACAAAMAVADHASTRCNPLFIHGGVGLGKTHLLQAICLRLLERHPDHVVLYLSCEGFLSRFIEAIRSGQTAEFRDRLRQADVLVIDDIHFLTRGDRTQDEFFHTFNALHQAGRQIVLSSDAPPDQIPDLEERLVSRFNWGLVADIKPPDFDTRLAIVRSKANLRGIDLPNDTAELIASSIDSNIRELEGALTRLQVQAQIEAKPISVTLARDVLGEPDETRPRVTLDVIAEAVTAYYSLGPGDLSSRRRPRSIALPRQISMYLARVWTSHSYSEIGRHFGRRDHTTVIHACRAITAKRRNDSNLDHDIRCIEGDLRKQNA